MTLCKLGEGDQICQIIVSRVLPRHGRSIQKHIILDQMQPSVHDRERPSPTRLAYRVRTLGRIAGNGRHSTLGTYFDDAMLTVVRSGRGRYIRRGGTVEVGAEHVGLVLPGTDVGILVSDRDDPYDHVYCRFSGRESLQIARRVARRRRDVFAIDARWRVLWTVLMRMISMGFSGGERGSALAVRDGAIVEALALLDGDPAVDAAWAHTSIWSADSLRGYLRDRVSDPIDLDRMARDFGVSRSTLTRRCRATLGQSVQAAWESVKLDLAAAMLSQTPLRIGEVAERVGYGPFYFSRRFSARFGVPPRQWRHEQLRRTQTQNSSI